MKPASRPQFVNAVSQVTTYSTTIAPDWSSQPHSAGEVLPLVMNRSK